MTTETQTPQEIQEDAQNGTKVWTRGTFSHYLRTSLIPDLKSSGHIFTAEDFETAVYFMMNPNARIREFTEASE